MKPTRLIGTAASVLPLAPLVTRFASSALVLALAGCGASLPVQAPSTDGARLLSSCAELRSEPDVTSWECEKLTAVETVVLSASDRDVAMAFDGFAASFGGGNARRIDSVYARGDSRHTAMRLEAEGATGKPVEAQMVAVSVGEGVRLVTCSSKDALAPCGPVVAHLVYDQRGPRDAGGKVPSETRTLTAPSRLLSPGDDTGGVDDPPRAHVGSGRSARPR